MIRNLMLSFFLLLLSGTVLWLTLQRLDPLGENQILAYVAFFVSFILFVTFFSTLCFFFGRELVRHRKLGTKQFIIALRRGFFVALFLSGGIALQLLGFASIIECAHTLTPEKVCTGLTVGYHGMFEVLLWGIFLFLVELMLTPPKRR